MELHDSGPEKFGEDDATQLQNSDIATPAAAAGAASQTTVTRVLNADAAGVVVLPAGTELGDIRIEGRDLVVIGADGVRYVIPDGAIIVPQLVIDDVAIPPLNLAALLVGNEPQPAAGNPQSSGGNFASAVGPIQAAYGLGDLLPYTELNFPQPEEREIIPNQPDREPTITIITVDQPVGAQSATATVAESGLPARNGEPAGTNSAAATEATSGTIVFSSPDGVASITINGVPFTGVGQVISSPRGDLLITSFDPVAGTIGFTYTLTDNLVGGTLADQFTISLADPDGDVATATLTVSATDDAPIARNDTDAVAAGSYAAESGNVVTAAGTTSGPAGADTPGADGAAVSRIASNNVPANTDTTFDAAGNLQVTGQYGTLLIKADGSYTYTRAAGTPGGVTDAFTYTLTDADGSTSTATLTISIGDAMPVVTSVPPTGVFEAGTLVFESGLPSRPGEAPGTNAPAPTETTSGKVTFTGGDGPVTATINGVAVAPGATVTVPGVGTLVVDTFDPVTGELTYTFTLADNTSGDNTSATFNVVITDVDGDTAPGTFVIAIRDDAPQAIDDSATQAVENAPISVNVLANDIPGADSVQPATVQLVAGTLSGTGTLVNNGDGTFTYTPGPGENGPVTFDYSITDGDGDSSSATVTIALIADSTPVVGEGPNLSVDEDGFGNANVDATPLQANPAEVAAGANLGDSGTVKVDFGGDVPADLAASIVLLDDPAYDGQLRTLDGNPVTFAVESGVLIGRDSGGAEVIRVTVTGAVAGPNPGEVVYTYSTQLSQPVQHGTPGTEDTVTLSGVTFQVTDLDGDMATGSFSVSVSDDVPSALAESGGSLAEGATVTGTLDFVAGADGATVTAIDGTALVFGADGFSQAVTLYDASDTIPVGTITVKADGTYSFTAANPLDNPVGAVATFTVTDRDGDAASAGITFTITDANMPTGGSAQAAVDDDGLSGGNPASTTFDLATDAGDALADGDETTFAGTLTFTDGGDAPATITFAAGVDGSFATVGTERVQYTVSGDTLTATVAAQDAVGNAQARAGTPLFTVQITDANAGTYLVTLVNNILHAGGPNEENPVGTDAAASIAFTVTDSDGSTAAATLAITFDDDAPTASAVSVTQATENAAFQVDITGSYAAGADGVDLSRVTWTQPTQGTVTYDGAGHFTYTPAAGAGSDSLGDSFTYTVVDGDGDTATATVNVTLQPDSAPVANDATAHIDDDGLPTGNAASNPAGTDDDQNAGEAGAGTASEAVWTGLLSVQAGANDTPLTYTLASAAGSGTVGTEAVDFTYDEMSHTLTATVAAGEVRAGTVLFTVAITDVNSGAYTVTLVNPIMHPSLDGQAGDDTENNVSVGLTFTVSDSDPSADSDTGILTIDFDDDTPTVTSSVITVTQGSENASFDFTLVEGTHFFEGADGVDLASGVTFTQATYGTISYDGAGKFTYAPDSGAGSDGNTSDSFTFTVTDADGDSVTKTVNVTLQPDSKPMAGTPTSLAVDEDGLMGANADDGQTDPAEVTGTNSASDLSGSVVVDYGNDVPADLLGSVVLVDLAAYDTQIKTLDGNFVTFALEFNTTTMRNDLVGRSVGGAEVIRIAITGATAGPNPGEVTYTYSTTLSLPIQHETAGTEDTDTLSGVTLQFTDGDDSDKTTASFDVTVRDDVPSLDVTVGAESGVVLTTQDAETDGDPTASDSATSTVGMVSAGFGGVFGLTFAKGADGGPTPSLTYVLALKTDGGPSGLESHDAAIYLYQLDDQTVVGSTSATNPGSIDGTAVFSVSVAADGTVTLVQYQQIDHPLADDPDASDAPFDDQFASLADDLITLTASSSLTDGDGDTASDSETINIGANLRFADDGPSLAGDVTAAAGVTIDETTAGPPASFGVDGIVATSMGAAITFAEAFGADGPATGGGLTYSLEITGPGGATPFTTAVGDYPVTLVQVDADTIEGRYTDSGMVVHTAFRLDIGSDGGLTLTQFVALEHTQDGNTAADYDDALYLTADGTAMGASLVSAGITVTDFDGDTATGSAAIGANVVFRDDGVDAVLDTGSVAAGSNAPITGNVLANDYRGADGSSVTAVSNADAGTTGTLAGDEITIQGQYGLLVVNVNTGAYTYTRDPGVGGGEQDVFSYTLTDSDGDFDSATLTISIGNLTPVAGSAQATVDDDGLASGNPMGTGDIDANNPAGRTADLDQMSTEAVFKGVLGGTLGDGTNTFTFLSMQTATTVGQETVSYTVSMDGSLLTATIVSSPAGRTGTLFTVEITDQTTGAYTLTLEKPVLHDTLDMLAGDDQENDASIDLAYQITDQDNDSSASPGTLNVLFDDDTPTASNVTATTLDDEGLGGIAGNGQSSGDAPGELTSTSGFLGYSAGADGLKSVTLSYASTTIGAEAVTGTSYVGGVLTISTARGAVMTVELTNAATGAYTITLLKPIVHATETAPGTENDATVVIGYKVTDGDNDTASGSVTVVVDDDTPTASNVTATTLDDEGLGGIAGNGQSSGDAPGELTSTSGFLGYSAGADGLKSVTLSYASTTIGAEAVTGTSYVGGVLTISTARGAVMTVELTNAATGAYTITLLKPIVHATETAPGTENDATVVIGYTVTDGDNDTASGSVTVVVDDDTPTASNVTATTLDDEGLGGIAGNGQSSGDAPGELTSTSGFLGYSAGADGLKSVTLSYASTTIGAEAVTGTSYVGGVLTISTARGAVMTVELTNAATGAYTITLLKPIVHATETAPGTENDATVVIGYTVTDGDNDTASGSVTVVVDDDTPINFTPAATSVINTGTALVTGKVLDTTGNGIFDNAGADGIKSIAFASSLDNALLTGASGTLQSGGQNIYTYIVNGALVATTDSNRADGLDPTKTVFTATIDAGTGTYSIDFDRTIDNGSGVKVGDFSAAAAGNTPWKGVDPDIFNGSTLDIASPNDPNPDSTDLLFIPLGGGAQNTINSDSDDIGVGTGQTVDKPEALRIDLVQDLRRDAGKSESDPDGYLYDTHVGVSQFTFKLIQVQGNANQTATVRIVAYNVTDSTDPLSLAQSDVANPGINTRVALNGSTLRVFNGTTDVTNQVVIVDEGDTIIVQGIKAGWSVTFGADGNATFEAVEIQNAADELKTAPNTLYGGNDFSLGGFAYSFVAIGAPVAFNLPVVLTDGDNDTSTGSISVTVNPVTPIVLDLDGDGVEFLGAAAGPVFDYNGDGNGVRTAWAGHDDGILAIDANGNGTVDDGSEVVFGFGGMTDLEGLAAKYDSNHDGVLDADDADFAKFGVWQDANGNGVSDAGEFRSLGELGIVSLSLTSDGVAYTAAGGDVSVAGSSTFTRADGTTGTLADAAFATAARSAQRTAEIVTTTALAGAAVNAMPVAAQPALVEASQAEATVAQQPTSIGREASAVSEAGTDDSRVALADFVSHEAAPQSGGTQHISGETSEVHFIANDTAFDDVAEAPAWLGAAADSQALQGTSGLFAGMGAEGTMQALLSIAPQATATDAARADAALTAIDSALSDFTGEALVDSIVEQFAAAGHHGPIEAGAAVIADTGPFMLMQGIGGAGADFATINLPDAHDDASMLAAAQA